MNGVETTIAHEAHGEGIGLHTGRETRIALKPAPAGSGVRFRRIDLSNGKDEDATIVAGPSAVADTRLGVRLARADYSVMTVEHLMAAFALTGVDNVLVEVDGPELPIFDGSVGPFIDLIESAGVKALDTPRRAIEIRAPMRVEDGDRFVEIAPYAGRRVELSIDYADAAIGAASLAFDLGDGGLHRRLASARTFCSRRDIDGMRAAGFAQGGALDNAIVVDGDRILNGPLRDPQEFALHKAVDLIGDFALLGAPVRGLIRAHKPGHDLNTRLVRSIAEATNCHPVRAAARSAAAQTRDLGRQ